MRDGFMVLCWSCQRWVCGKCSRSEESRPCKRRGHGNTLKHRTSLSTHFVPSLVDEKAYHCRLELVDTSSAGLAGRHGHWRG